MATTTDYEQLVDDWYALFNGDFAKLDVVSESIDFYDPMAEIHSRDELEGFIQEMHSAFPDLHLTVTEMLAGDGLVMVEWSVSGTHEGELNGIPPTGRQVDHKGMEKLVIADGTVEESFIYFDQQEMLTQLGLTDE